MGLRIRLAAVEGRLGALVSAAAVKPLDPRIVPVAYKVAAAGVAHADRRFGLDREPGRVLSRAELMAWREGLDRHMGRALDRLRSALDGPPETLAAIIAEIEAECANEGEPATLPTA